MSPGEQRDRVVEALGDPDERPVREGHARVLGLHTLQAPSVFDPPK
jgi:hypothetical protein